jgi:hypothetical protein
MLTNVVLLSSQSLVLPGQLDSEYQYVGAQRSPLVTRALDRLTQTCQSKCVPGWSLNPRFNFLEFYHKLQQILGDGR